MGLVIAGIDEAGYGPMLGPLTVGMAVLRLESWKSGDAAPDFWRLLSRCVCQSPRDARGRLAIADSKKLKLPNDGRRHPLAYIERAVLSVLVARGESAATDDDLFSVIGCDRGEGAWYGGESVRLPAAHTPEQLALAANALRIGLERASCRVLDVRCCRIGERAFNEAVASTGTKAAATLIGIGSHLRRVMGSEAARAGSGDEVRVVCDRLGGRTRYAGALARVLPGATVVTIEESDELCRYRVERDGRRMVVLFMPECESAHLPVALASLVAKYVRELAMMRFNRYWCGRFPELKPTAGYVTDARRWLAEAALSDAEREALVRIA